VVCPRCGKPVVAGYVRCPDRTCRQLLSRSPTQSTGSPGGTVAKASPLPAIAMAAAGATALAVVIWLLVRDGGKAKTDPAAGAGSQDTAAAAVPGTAATGTQPRANPAIDPAPTPLASGPDPRGAASDLERELRRQRLWSTVEVFGDRADIRSNVCAEAGLVAAVNGATAALRTAGLTRLRCLEQSGRVVFIREL
jgi:hypothetical protein